MTYTTGIVFLMTIKTPPRIKICPWQLFNVEDCLKWVIEIKNLKFLVTLENTRQEMPRPIIDGIFRHTQVLRKTSKLQKVKNRQPKYT